MLQGIHDKLYIYEYGVDMSIDLEDPNLDFEQLDWKDNLYTYQPETDQWDLNFMYDQEKGDSLTINNIYEENMYYSYWNSKTENELWRKKTDDSEEDIYLGSFPQYGYMADSEYLYTYWRRDSESDMSQVVVYDYEGNLKQIFQLPANKRLEWIPGTKDYVFGYCEGQESENGPYESEIIIIERSKLAEGTAKMITLIKN